MSDTTASEGGGNSRDDDVKQRFREALARKQAKNKAGESHADKSNTAAHPHGPLSHKRDFRRKSG
ncbi:DUF5302 domain-containing protein [Saccharomonospora xinjiangensis]|uniref:DUF5302 domain-containing protein n=1 Tax=Saccharomonospora xinjiangensis TaxID=75294 RepID=UPI00106F6F32|nr:DUF5302 domain-containing protein [Saccharomonospora xinjiangensis]QBQ61440.1 hypothetical protein EYD13_15460 [Saccharomonospora xinjiangensis]